MFRESIDPPVECNAVKEIAVTNRPVHLGSAPLDWQRPRESNGVNLDMPARHFSRVVLTLQQRGLPHHSLATRIFQQLNGSLKMSGTSGGIVQQDTGSPLFLF
jgi:hypothetical protein